MPPKNRTRSRRSFGSVRKLPSGRHQARYLGPDGKTHNAHVTFDTKGDAQTWLDTVRADIVREVWKSPDQVRAEQQRERAASVTFAEYATPWLADRDVKPRTRALYESLLRVHLGTAPGLVDTRG